MTANRRILSTLVILRFYTVLAKSEQAITNADRTFFQLRKDIVEGAIPAGSKLSEMELSTKYEVSRAVIREAINRLATCHLVERKANVGARVVALSPEGLIQLYQTTLKPGLRSGT